MKKIIALLLALTCVFALVACGDDPAPTPDGGDTPNYENLAPFTAAIAASNPASASISVSQIATQFNVTMNGEYDVVYNEDGSATIEYSYDKFNEITDETTEVTTTVTGTATVAADGTVLPISGEKYADRTLEFDMKIDESNLAYKIFMDLGFEWGGSWSTVKDYQHFEKRIDLE